jgi:hypothetical protein
MRDVGNRLDVFLMKQEIYSAIALFTSGARDVQSAAINKIFCLLI